MSPGGYKPSILMEDLPGSDPSNMFITGRTSLKERDCLRKAFKEAWLLHTWRWFPFAAGPDASPGLHHRRGYQTSGPGLFSEPDEPNGRQARKVQRIGRVSLLNVELLQHHGHVDKNLLLCKTTTNACTQAIPKLITFTLATDLLNDLMTKAP